MPIYLVIAFVAAFAYSIGGLFNKQAISQGAGLMRIIAISAWTPAILLMPTVFLYSDPMPLHLWYQPLIASLFFSGGTTCYVIALRTGDLSIVAPVSGAKPIMNAVLVSALLGITVPATTWIAGALTLGALFIMRTPNHSTDHSFARTATITLMAIFGYALCDTSLMLWASAWGVTRFAVITFSIASIVALFLIPRFSGKWCDMTRSAKRNILLGAFFSSLPAVTMSYALGTYGHAPEINVVYASRALISIVIVFALGRWVGSSEQNMSRSAWVRRLIGAMVLTGAVLLVILCGSD